MRIVIDILAAIGFVNVLSIAWLVCSARSLFRDEDAERRAHPAASSVTLDQIARATGNNGKG